jgi:hypothetical protein
MLSTFAATGKRTLLRKGDGSCVGSLGLEYDSGRLTTPKTLFFTTSSSLCGDADRKQIVSDPHSPWQYQANGGVWKIDPWYTAINARPVQLLSNA